MIDNVGDSIAKSLREEDYLAWITAVLLMLFLNFFVYCIGWGNGYYKGYSTGRTMGVTETLKHIKAGSE